MTTTPAPVRPQGCTTPGQAPVGLFAYDIADDRWWWSDGMFAIHGFDPGEVVPSTAVLMSHKHPDDAAQAQATLDGVLADGEVFSCRHRIIDARGMVRQVVSVGEGVRGEDGALETVRGYFIDIGAAVEESARLEADAAISTWREHRAVVEQAKGAVMAVYALDEAEAFAMLRTLSMDRNAKLHALCRHLVTQLRCEPYAAMPPQVRLRRIIVDVSAWPTGDLSRIR